MQQNKNAHVTQAELNQLDERLNKIEKFAKGISIGLAIRTAHFVYSITPAAVAATISFANSVKESAISGFETLKTGFNGMQEVTLSGYAQAAEQAKTAMDAASTYAGQASSTVVEAAKQAAQVASNSSEAVTTALSETASKASSAVSTFTADAATSLFNAKEYAAQVASNSVTPIANGFTSLKDGAAATLTNASANVSTFVNDSYDTLVGSTDKVVETAPVAQTPSVLENAKNALSGFYEGAKSYFVKPEPAIVEPTVVAEQTSVVTTVTETVTTKFTNLYNGATSYFTKTEVVIVEADVTPAVAEPSLIENVATTAANKYNDMYNGVMSYFTKSEPVVVEQVVIPEPTVTEKITSSAHNMFESAKSYFVKPEPVVEPVVTADPTISEQFFAHMNSVADGISANVAYARDSVTNAATYVADSASSAVNSASDTVNGAIESVRESDTYAVAAQAAPYVAAGVAVIAVAAAGYQLYNYMQESKNSESLKDLADKNAPAQNEVVEQENREVRAAAVLHV